MASNLMDHASWLMLCSFMLNPLCPQDEHCFQYTTFPHFQLFYRKPQPSRIYHAPRRKIRDRIKHHDICSSGQLSSSHLLSSSPSTTSILCVHLPLGMELTLRSFLLFLRKLVSFFRKRWDQSTRKLWYIVAFLRSRFSSPHPKNRDEIRRSIVSRPENPPATVICASRLPPQLTQIPGCDIPIITSPKPIHIRVRKATILDPEDSLYETQDNYNSKHLGVNSYQIGRAHV